MTSGKVRVSEQTAAANIVTLSYDQSTDIVVGLGIQTAGGKLQRTISSLDPKTLKVTVRGVATRSAAPRCGAALGRVVLPCAHQRARARARPRPQTVGKTNVEVIESGGISSYNSDSKGLYWIGDKTGNDDFFLVQNSVEAGAKVLSTGDLCANDAACPWSLEYYPGA